MQNRFKCVKRILICAVTTTLMTNKLIELCSCILVWRKNSAVDGEGGICGSGKNKNLEIYQNISFVILDFVYKLIRTLRPVQ
ncbi:hypothetical protein BpHYR1_040186 [Brachionus plicatilis]|uniref:Uncharacterized protein n=1 Tax=Brachionus plicatilis TaxID=10195 RepID=A0A3M7QI93_BRAPC|nr:hypothetical protein BpHYR1_040186 [Brachionus plicatilis]